MNDLHDQFNREAALQLLHPPLYDEVNAREASHDLDSCCKVKKLFYHFDTKKFSFVAIFCLFNLYGNVPKPTNTETWWSTGWEWFAATLSLLCSNCTLCFYLVGLAWTYRTPPRKEGKGTSFFYKIKQWNPDTLFSFKKLRSTLSNQMTQECPLNKKKWCSTNCCCCWILTLEKKILLNEDDQCMISDHWSQAS